MLIDIVVIATLYSVILITFVPTLGLELPVRTLLVWLVCNQNLHDENFYQTSLKTLGYMFSILFLHICSVLDH